jgi:hypothetical protein
VDTYDRDRLSGGAAHYCNVIGGAGGCLVVHDTDGADIALAICTKALLNQRRLHTTLPAFVAGQADTLRRLIQSRGHPVQQACKVAGFVHQDAVAGTHRVEQGRLARASAFRPNSPNFGSWQSMVGRLMARRMRSSTGDGQGESAESDARWDESQV